MKQEKKVCPICGKEYYDYGNNAQPVMNGRCCDECNWNVVIPARLGVLNRERFEHIILGH